MTTRRQWHLSALSAVVSAALLVACGGGGSDEELKVGKIVSFGDSLSDLGTYAGITSIAGTGAPPVFAGRFTTNTFTGYTAASNTNTATNWVEWVSARVGYPITQAVAGFATTVIPCPAARSIPSLADSCTAYAQGGSRVTNPNGIGHSDGALTFPVVTQIANHLSKPEVAGKFGGDDIVLVWAGSNDFGYELNNVQAGAYPPATAIANMQTAAAELVALVKDQILANGAKRVAVLNVVDIADTPRFVGLPEENKAFLRQLTAEFNTVLESGLAGTKARIIDTRTLFANIVASPASYGFTNVNTAACDPAKIEIVTKGYDKEGSANFCNASPAAAFTAAGLPNLNTMKTGATAAWAFADGIHPSTSGQKAIGDFVITNLKNYGWIPPNL